MSKTATEHVQCIASLCQGGQNRLRTADEHVKNSWSDVSGQLMTCWETADGAEVGGWRGGTTGPGAPRQHWDSWCAYVNWF